MKINHILCAIDKSSSSVHALKFAMKLTLNFNAELKVIHVFSPDLRMKDDFRAGKINELTTYIKQNGIEDIDLEFKDGYLVEVVHKLSKQSDLTVIGIRGSHHTNNYYGSNASQIIHKVDCPVFLIPDTEVEFNFKKIVLSTDFKDLRAEERLEFLRDIVNHFDSELHLLHISENEKVLDKTESKEAIEMHQAFNDLNHAFFMVEDTDIIHGLKTYLSKNNPDLLVIMPRKSTGFVYTLSQSIVEELNNIPIFSIHA